VGGQQFGFEIIETDEPDHAVDMECDDSFIFCTARIARVITKLLSDH
jgi:hypothetical protein